MSEKPGEKISDKGNEPREPLWDPTPPVRPPLGVELTYRSEAALLVAWTLDNRRWTIDVCCT